MRWVPPAFEAEDRNEWAEPSSGVAVNTSPGEVALGGR